MAYYRGPKIRKCKHCDKPAKKNITSDGRNKGYFITCGSKECISKSYNTEEVINKKKYGNKGIKGICEHCSNDFVKTHYGQKWCSICVPNKASRAILTRYNISYPEYMIMISNTPNCPICERLLTYPVIDHCHKTGTVRGLICNHCNTALNIIEDNEKLKRALKYLNKE